MILFHAKRDGTVTTTPNFVPQGSSMQDLVVVSEFDYAYCAIKLLPASGEYIEDVPCTPIPQKDYSTIFTAALPPKATVVAGSVDYQLIFTAADGTTQTTLVGSFTVPRGVPVSTPGSVGELSVKTINDLYTIMDNIYDLFDGHEGNIRRNTEDIAALKKTVSSAGYVTIPVTEWEDGSPTIATFTLDGFGKGMSALLMPADINTQTAAREARLSAFPDVSQIDDDTQTVEIIRANADKAPGVQLRFAYMILKTSDTTVAPSVAIIGVDAYGEGGADLGDLPETVDALDETVNSPTSGLVRRVKQLEGVSSNYENFLDTYAEDMEAVGDRLTAAEGAVPAHNVSTDSHQDIRLEIKAHREEVNGKLADYDKSTAVNNKISSHNASTESHSDLRLELQRLADRLNAVLNSDDTSLDDLKEIVAYIKSNKTLIDGITSSKVSITDIIDNLVTNVSNQPLSAAQGVILKRLIDDLETELGSYIKTVDIVNGLTSTDTDKPLSAAQGTRLKELIDLLDAGKLTSDEANDLIANALKLYTPTDKLPSALPTPHKLIINGVEFNGSETIQLDLDELPIVTSTADMTDESQLYVLEATGHIWRYREVKGSTNWLKEVGYQYGVRVDNKNGAEITNDETLLASVTGYIPCAPGQKVTIRGLEFGDGGSSYGSIIPVFDQNKNIFSRKHLKYFSGNQGDIKKADNGDYYFTMPAVATTTSDDGKITAVAPVAFFRAQFAIETPNPDSGNIAVGEEMTDYETGYHWVDTGIAYTWGNDTALLALEDRVTATETKIGEIEAKLASSLSVPDYWQDHIAAKIAEIQNAQTAARQRCVTWATVTDIHDDSNAGGTGRLIKAVCDQCGINTVLCLGDYSTRATKATADRCRQSIGNSNNILAPVADRLLGVRGNHDGGYKTSDAYLLKPSEVDSLVQYPMATGLEITYDAVGSGYYATDKSHKVRYIMLNTDHRGANPDSTVASDGSSSYPYMSFYRYTQVQMDMVKEALITIPNDSWTVVVASHVPPIGSVDRYGDGSFVVDLSIRLEDYLAMRKLINAYVNRTTATVSFSGSATWDKINLTVDFTAAKGHLAEYQSGHLHRYLYFGADHVDPKSKTALGFPIRTIRSDGFNENYDSTNGSELDDAYANQRVLGTTTEHSFVVCVHNIDTRETTCIHVGAQES